MLTDTLKAEIGPRLREKQEQAGYTREKLSELCSLSPRFIANIELGDSTFSLDPLRVVCRVLSCSSDYLLFGNSVDNGAWSDVISQLVQLDVKYQEPVNKILHGLLEAVTRPCLKNQGRCAKSTK